MTKKKLSQERKIREELQDLKKGLFLELDTGEIVMAKGGTKHV